jgi:hypothetical protein
LNPTLFDVSACKAVALLLISNLIPILTT